MTSAVLLLCVLTALWLAGGTLMGRLRGLFVRGLRLDDVDRVDPDGIAGMLTHVARDARPGPAPGAGFKVNRRGSSTAYLWPSKT